MMSGILNKTGCGLLPTIAALALFASEAKAETVKCPNAQPGTRVNYNNSEKPYVVVDNGNIHTVINGYFKEGKPEEIQYLCTSQVTGFYELFKGRTRFNVDISDWDTSNVENMYKMFAGASSFNNGGQPLTWDVREVQRMTGMFQDATSLNVPIQFKHTDQVEDMSAMFSGASAFNNGDETFTLNTASVTHMRNMFSHATSFNQPLEGWDVSNVEDMSFMFLGACQFSQDLSHWNTSAATTEHKGFAWHCPSIKPANLPNGFDCKGHGVYQEDAEGNRCD